MKENLAPRRAACLPAAAAGAAALSACFGLNAPGWIALCLLLLLLRTASAAPSRREIGVFSVFAGLFGVMRVLGHSFDGTDSWGLVMKDGRSLALSLCACLSLYAAALCGCVLLNRLLQRASAAAAGARLRPSERRLLFFSAALVLFLGSLPYLLLYAPGLNIADTRDQILQFFGLPSVLGDGGALTDHHPALTTLCYGLFMRLGLRLGSADLGQLCYSLVWLTVMSAAMARLLLTLSDEGLDAGAVRALAIFWALWPVPALYAFNMCKDVSAAPFAILYAAGMIRLRRGRGGLPAPFWIRLFLCCLMLCLTRKSALPSLLFGLALLLPAARGFRLRLALSAGGAAAVCLAVQLLLLPALGVLPGETREMLSVPFQQTARTLRDSDDVTEEERAAIARVLDIESAASAYDPRLADPVKDRCNPEMTGEDLRAYLACWAKMGLRHPSSYLCAWLNLVYGYFYPSESNTIVCLTLNSPEAGPLSLTQDEGFAPLRLEWHNIVYYRLRRIPLLGSLFYADTVAWAFLFLLLALFAAGGFGAAAPFGFFLGQALVCLLSPKSGEIRYLLMVMYALPAMLGALLLEGRGGGARA